MRFLAFEAPLQELYEKISDLRKLSDSGEIDLSIELSRIEERAEGLKKEIYSNLKPNQIIQISRHPNRPDSLSLIRLIFDQFTQLHGDRLYKDDLSIVGGLASIGPMRFVVIGHQKGHDTKENIYRNFGMPHPEGYRKALRLMKMANKFSLPIITFIDTPGAFPGKEAEERGQAEAIATNLKEMSAFEVPILSFVIGEGGSGGALGIGVANRLFMLQYAIYSVISPEGCASILFRDAGKAAFAAENLKITAKDIVELGVGDGIVQEPLGGAHHDWKATAQSMRTVIKGEIDSLSKLSPTELVEDRYQKFRNMGQFES